MEVTFLEDYSPKEVALFTALGLYDKIRRMSALSLFSYAAIWVFVHEEHYKQHSPKAVESLRRCLYRFNFDTVDPVYRNSPAWQDLIQLE